MSGEPASALESGPIPDFEDRSDKYRVRFAHGSADLDAICRLRFQVFNLEMGEGLDRSRLSGVDYDRFDAQCQHLMV